MSGIGLVLVQTNSNRVLGERGVWCRVWCKIYIRKGQWWFGGIESIFYFGG
jgi:hypothetical protein